MKTLLKLFVVSALTVFVFNCSGSRKGAESSGAAFEDAQVQAQVEQLQEKIAKEPSNPVYRRQLATVYQENGNKLEALKTLETAMSIDPHDAETRYQYAGIATDAGFKVKAYRAYKEILQGPQAEAYLDRIAPLFSDVFKVIQITDTQAQEGFASFSAEGNKIVYQSDVNGNWDIFEMDTASKAIKQITRSAAHEESPQYSPDGRKLLFTSTEEDHRDVEYERKLRDIYVMDLESMRSLNLTTNGADDWAPSYSDDGRHIVFVSDRADLRDVPFYKRFGNIYLMENDGRFQMQLCDTSANDDSPCIAPGSSEDNGTIYFDSDCSGSKAIYSMDFKGDNLRQITFNPQANDAGPSISPRGDKIAFISDRDGNFEIYTMNSDGSAQQRLTSNPADDLHPVFSPDGQKILFHSNRSGNYDLYMMDLSTKSGTAGTAEIIDNIDAAIRAAE